MSSKTRTRKNRTTGTTSSARTLRSVPDHATVAAVRTDAEDKLWAALYARPNSTATDLAGAAKIGKSTAGKILAKWHQDGSVSRTAGIAKGGRRAADLWTITPVNADPTDTSDTPQAGSTTTTVGPDTTDTDDTTPTKPTNTAPTDTAPADTAADDNAADDIPEVADSTATDAADAKPVPDASPPTVGGTAGTDADTPIKEAGHEKAARLAPGALRGLVEDYLRDHPGEEFGPTAIAKALGGKSSGAVSNALDKLVADGTAVKTKDTPRRFALTSTEQSAATAPAK